MAASFDSDSGHHQTMMQECEHIQKLITIKQMSPFYIKYVCKLTKGKTSYKKVQGRIKNNYLVLKNC